MITAIMLIVRHLGVLLCSGALVTSILIVCAWNFVTNKGQGVRWKSSLVSVPLGWYSSYENSGVAEATDVLVTVEVGIGGKHFIEWLCLVQLCFGPDDSDILTILHAAVLAPFQTLVSMVAVYLATVAHQQH
jgi:hypothetical protein